MICFPDVNVWIALVVAEHVHHEAAVAWLEEHEWESLVFSRVTQMGFLRLLTNVHVMGRRVVSVHGAWAILDQLGRNPGIRSAAEPFGIEQVWRELTAHSPSGSNFWTGTYLAAFAQASAYTLVTFDRGFSRYKNLRLKVPGAAGP